MKQKISLSLAAIASIGLWSCADTASDQPGAGAPDQTTGVTAFFGFKIDEPDMRTRDTHKEYDDEYERYEWFNKGTKDERAIADDPESNRVLFFNADYSYFGCGKLQKPDVTTATSNIYVAQKTVEGEANPSYALVIMNGDPERLDALDTKLAAAGEDAVRTAMTFLNDVDTENPESLAMYNGFFTMSSTVYREEDSDNIVDLNYLNPEKPVFYETVEEAIQPENLTTFYVERILAKSTLLVTDEDGFVKRFSEYGGPILMKGPNKLNIRRYYSSNEADQAKDVMTSWRANIVNWGLNGLEKNTYLVKNLVENPATYPFSLSTNYYSGWNSPTLMRSYWGVDENYSTGVYPDQYRQALDVDGVKAATNNTIYSSDYDGELEKGDYTLIYRPYTAFEDFTENKYSLENTFDAKILSDQDLATQPWLRCGTHIIITAQLIMDEIDTDVDAKAAAMTRPGYIEGVSDKYLSNGLWWTEKALKEQAVATLMTNIYYNKKGDNYRIPDVINGGFVDYINYPGSEDGTIRERVLNTDVPVLVVEDGVDKPLRHEDLEANAEKYFEFAPAFIKGGDGWITLKKKDGVVLKANYINHEPVEITDAQIISYIYRFTNLAKHYKEGRMYYAIPIRHNLESVGFTNPNNNKVYTGDYGMVRNTWYRMTLTELLKPGTPVDDPEQPIIPNPEPDDKSLGVEVEIIPWRTVEINVDQLH